MNANHRAARTPKSNLTSRRDFVRNCGLGALGLACVPILRSEGANSPAVSGPASLLVSLEQDWLFGGKFTKGSDKPEFKDATFTRVNLPNTVTKLSWQNWDPATWQAVWIYRRRFRLPETFRGHRIFVDFNRAIVKATPSINGHALPEHLGGYLPFSREITSFVNGEDNLLAVTVDSRWQSVPPDGSPKGVSAVDYYEPGGITGSVTLRAVPQTFISNVFAKPVNVLKPDRSIQVTGTLDSAVTPDGSLTIRVKMFDGTQLVTTAATGVAISKPGKTEFSLGLANLGDVKLWDVDQPHLYTIVTTLLNQGKPVHDHRTRIGLRDARFEVDGFFLNGRQLRLFGLNRHEIYPYTGLAMPDRVMRRDAEILKHEFNCNIVRCSHYPQSPAFLDACDEFGLMVWEETPGWGYLGDGAWKELVVQNVTDMVLRDRNRPSVVIWGVRINESKNDVALYKRTTAIAKSLDGTRPCSGSMTPSSKQNWQKDWHEDVFALDNYHGAKDGSVAIDPPLPGVPYMLAETVGQYSYGKGKKGFMNQYRRAGDLEMQTDQALFHAQAHSKAAAYGLFCGVIAWCAFDYSSPKKSFNGIKCPGVADVFRIPKLGASFYQAQVSPKVRPIIQPSFYWDFGTHSPHGPGKRAAIFSNCEQLEIFVAGKSLATLQPDNSHYPHIAYPPFFCDLDIDAAEKPEFRIDGYLGGKLALSKSFSADAAHDQFLLSADDSSLTANGTDATRLVFQVADKFGQPRAFAGGEITLELSGPGIIVGDNSFSLTDSGGVGAIWIKSIAGKTGQISINVRHSSLGERIVTIATV